MEEKLKKLSEQRKKMAEQLAKLDEEERALKNQIVINAGTGLFNDTFELASMFKPGGPVFEKHEAIRKRLKNLKRLDPNYLSTLASGSHYGAESTEGTQWLISYLLGGCWREDSDLWTVLSKVAELHDMPGNIFTMEDKNNG